ncbi:Uridine phosphorylase 1 [Operophtera brumata]|uniref:Uridine phosphorylase 1 n=1 Tax=Operophtera brumata TaxID=104452 RepID=A0A0L7L6V6_OPEBR|nr:Uridine phosphorylase 1 [Operophtera brumata]
MESLAFAALTHHAGIKAAVICVTLLDRLKGDQGRLSLDGHGSIAVKSPRRFKLVQQESETYD